MLSKLPPALAAFCLIVVPLTVHAQTPPASGGSSPAAAAPGSDPNPADRELVRLPTVPVKGQAEPLAPAAASSVNS